MPQEEGKGGQTPLGGCHLRLPTWSTSMDPTLTSIQPASLTYRTGTWAGTVLAAP